MSSEHLINVPMVLVIKDMQIKSQWDTTNTSVRMTNTKKGKKPDSISCWQWFRANGTYLFIAGGNIKYHRCFRKHFGDFSNIARHKLTI